MPASVPHPHVTRRRASYENTIFVQTDVVDGLSMGLIVEDDTGWNRGQFAHSLR